MADSVTISTPSTDGTGAERIRKMVREYLDTMETGRKQSEVCRDYYDSKQWSAEEIATLRARGQPPIVFNRVKRKVDSILGVERRQRTDPKAYPRTPKDEQSAEVATQALRFVADQTRLNNIFSGTFENGMIEGTGAVEVIVEGAGDDIDIKVNLIPWANFVYDPRSIRHDFSDARYLGVLQWMDADDAIALYPNKKTEIEAALTGSGKAFVADTSVEDKPASGSWIDSRRRRLQVCQLYYKQGGEHMYAVVAGNVLIQDGPSYYKDEKGRTVCPIEAFSAYIDRENQRYGVVLDMRGPQDEINHRRSKAVHFLHSRRVMAMQGVVPDVAAAKREIARPDGWVEVADPDRLQILDTAQETTGNLNMLQEAKAEIDLLGPNNALQGKGTEDQSGRAIIAQQQAGLAELAPLYDRFNDLKLRVYRAIWQRIKQSWRAPKWVRVTDDEQAPQFIGLNQMMMDPMTGQPTVQNAVAKMDVDIIIDTGPDTINLQGEEFEQLTQVMPQLAQLPPPYAMALIEASSMPSARKQKIMEMLKGGGEQDPEAQAAAQKQQQIMERGALAEIATKESAAALNMAKAKSEAENAQAQTRLEQQKLAAEQSRARGDFTLKLAQIELEREKLVLERENMVLEREKLALQRDELVVNTQLKREEGEQNARMADRQASDDKERSDRELAIKEAPHKAEQEKGEREFAALDKVSVALAEGLERMGEEIGQGMSELAKAYKSPRRLVKDPVTGEKRVEI